MKNTMLKSAALLFISAATFTACNKPQEAIPVPVEQELITTVQLIVTNSEGFNKTFKYKVENGFNNSTPGGVERDVIALQPNKEYDVEVQILNEKETPAENITDEIISENNEHLFLFLSNPVTGAGAISTFGGNVDNAGKPFNQKLKFKTDAAGNGELTVVLKHQPTNKAATSPEAAGGETDVEAQYNVTVQ